MAASVILPGTYASPQKITEGLFNPQPAPRRDLKAAIAMRNQAWQGNHLIPPWVVPEEVGLDRFFTRPAVAQSCWKALLELMDQDHADTQRYTFIDPAAGDGAFFDLLPKERRIGVEVVPSNMMFDTADYLSWQPPSQENGRRYAVIGNPPFGYRAWLALAFVNHSATFADYMGFILPMAFQSNGKGSPKFRVEGAELVQTMDLPLDAFVYDTGQSVKINALWQVWRRGVNNRKPVATCNDWAELFTVDIRKERLCGHERLHEADWFLQRTFYGEPPTLVRDFEDVRYGCGYGIILKKRKRDLTQALRQTDWKNYSNLAAHSCRHISMEHIRAALSDAGFVDG